MDLRRLGAIVVLSLTALAFGFLLASQLRTQLLVPSDRVGRNAALVQTVRDLQDQNGTARANVSRLRRQIDQLEQTAAAGSDSLARLQADVRALRARVGTAPVRGPGVVVDLANGKAAQAIDGGTGYLVNYEDVQDVVNLLFEGGAEAVAVNGRRITPASAFRGAGTTVLIDQGPPLVSPFRIAAIGNRGQMEQLLSDPATLGDLRNRVRAYGIQLGFQGTPEVGLPAYDSSFGGGFARP